MSEEQATAVEVDKKALEADTSTDAQYEDILSSPTAVQPHQWSKYLFTGAVFGPY